MSSWTVKYGSHVLFSSLELSTSLVFYWNKCCLSMFTSAGSIRTNFLGSFSSVIIDPRIRLWYPDPSGSEFTTGDLYLRTTEHWGWDPPGCKACYINWCARVNVNLEKWKFESIFGIATDISKCLEEIKLHFSTLLARNVLWETMLWFNHGAAAAAIQIRKRHVYCDGIKHVQGGIMVILAPGTSKYLVRACQVKLSYHKGIRRKTVFF